MTHNEWTKELKTALALSRQEPARAVERLRKLARTAADSDRKVVNSWHTTQALGFAASILSEGGHHRKAASILRKVAKLHKEALLEHGHALVSSLESAALELFKAGAADAAIHLAREAMSHFGNFPDPSTIHEDVVRRLRTHVQERASKRRVRKTG
jgi:N6-adenosine-specific RNA methylase IME4